MLVNVHENVPIFACLVFGMAARVDDAVHVEIEIVILDAVGILLRVVHRDLDAVDNARHLFNHLGRELAVLVGEPPEQRRNSNDAPRVVSSAQRRPRVKVPSSRDFC